MKSEKTNVRAIIRRFAPGLLSCIAFTIVTWLLSPAKSASLVTALAAILGAGTTIWLVFRGYRFMVLWMLNRELERAMLLFIPSHLAIIVTEFLLANSMFKELVVRGTAPGLLETICMVTAGLLAFGVDVYFDPPQLPDWSPFQLKPRS
ncbi:hypothetical protein KBC79_02565 [Candidatus Woesebacteria bacterium]|nr:hypothetical protein [Candidatus Woesebacteria bacterium]